MAEPRPTIGPTTWRSVGLAVTVGAGAAWIALQAWQYAGGTLPEPGTGSWGPTLLLAAVTGAVAVTTRRAIGRGEPLDATLALTRLRMGKASILAAAALAAAYLVLLALSLVGWPAPLAQTRTWESAVAAIAAALWGGAGWALERACRIPPDPDDAPGGPAGGS